MICKHWKVVQGHATLKTPFLGHFLDLKTHHFKPYSSPRQPNSFFFFFNIAFSSPIFINFNKSSAPKTQILAKISYRNRSQLQAQKSAPENLLLKTCAAHTFPIFFSTPSGLTTSPENFPASTQQTPKPECNDI